MDRAEALRKADGQRAVSAATRAHGARPFPSDAMTGAAAASADRDLLKLRFSFSMEGGHSQAWLQVRYRPATFRESLWGRGWSES